MTLAFSLTNANPGKSWWNDGSTTPWRAFDKRMMRDSAWIRRTRKLLQAWLSIWSGLAASAILADGFVDKGVELVAGERNVSA